jgi:hypothetical protein
LEGVGERLALFVEELAHQRVGLGFWYYDEAVAFVMGLFHGRCAYVVSHSAGAPRSLAAR